MKITTLTLLAALPVLAARETYGYVYAPLVPVAAWASAAADAPLPDYGVYTLAGAAGGKFIEVSGDLVRNEKYADGRPLVQYEASLNGSGQLNGWQKWYVVYQATYNGARYYQLRNAFSGKLLTVPGGTAAPGTQLQQYQEMAPASGQQLWRVEQTGTTGQYRLVNRGSGLALSNASAPTNNGGTITQEALVDGAPTQQWALAAQTASAYRDDAVVRFFNRNDPTQGSAAFDEGMSIPLHWGANAGKVLWVTQDAADGDRLRTDGSNLFNCGKDSNGKDIININYSNSLLLQPSLTNWASTAPNVTIPGGSNGRPRQVFDLLTKAQNNDLDDYQHAWPGAGIEIGNHVYIQCGEGGTLDTTKHIAGSQSLYDFTESATGTQWTTKRTIPNGLGKGVPISYAEGMIQAADGFVYVFGTHYTGYTYSNIHVARFPASNPQAWTYWNGSSWGNAPVTGAAARIGEGKGSNNVGYVNGRYVLMSLSQGYNCGDSPRAVYVATASSPTGPFTPFTKVYDIQEYFGGQNARYYTPGVHPEFVNGHDELLLTYSLNYSACGLDACVNGTVDPYFYRVKGIRVPYSQIGVPPTPPSSVTTVYKDCSYKGTATSLTIGDYTLAALQSLGVLDNDLSSLRVSSGYRVVLYTDDNFTGSSLTLRADNSCLVFNALGGGSWNDQVSSLRVQTDAAPFSQQLEAEAADSNNGMFAENCSEGGQDMGYVDPGDNLIWNITVPTSGTYLIEYRVASPNGGTLSADLNAGSIALGTTALPATSNYQKWATASQTVSLPAGIYNFRVLAQTGGWNINWVRISQAQGSGARLAAPLATTTSTHDDEQLSLYPNPVGDQLRLATAPQLAGSTYRVVNTLGQTVGHGTLGSTLNVASLPVGLYQLVVTTTDQQTLSRRFTKE